MTQFTYTHLVFMLWLDVWLSHQEATNKPKRREDRKMATDLPIQMAEKAIKRVFGGSREIKISVDGHTASIVSNGVTLCSVTHNGGKSYTAEVVFAAPGHDMMSVTGTLDTAHHYEDVMIPIYRAKERANILIKVLDVMKDSKQVDADDGAIFAFETSTYDGSKAVVSLVNGYDDFEFSIEGKQAYHLYEEIHDYAGLSSCRIIEHNGEDDEYDATRIVFSVTMYR